MSNDEILMKLNRCLFEKIQIDQIEDYQIIWSSDSVSFRQLWKLSQNEFNYIYGEIKEQEVNLQEHQALLCSSCDISNVVGVCMAWRNIDINGKQVGWIQGLKIRRGWMGMGLSKIILDAIIFKLYGKGYDDIYLLAETNNFVAIELYRSFGFEPFLESKEEGNNWSIILEKSLKRRNKLRIQHQNAVEEDDEEEGGSIRTMDVKSLSSIEVTMLVQNRLLKLKTTNNFLIEVSKYFAVCGLGALIYSCFILPNLSDDNDDCFGNDKFFEEMTYLLNVHFKSYQTLLNNKITALRANGLLQEGFLRPEDLIPDIFLCWSLRSYLELKAPVMFMKQQRFSKLFEWELKPRIAFDFAHGDLCLTPDAMVLLASAAMSDDSKKRNVRSMSIHSVNDLAMAFTLFDNKGASKPHIPDSQGEKCLSPIEDDVNGEGGGERGMKSLLRTEFLLVGKGVEGVNDGVDCDAQPQLNHWFVISDLLKVPSSQSFPSSQFEEVDNNCFSGNVWNFTGNAGEPFYLKETFCQSWFEELSIVHIIAIQ